MNKTFKEELRYIILSHEPNPEARDKELGHINDDQAIASIQKLVEELIGDPEYRETDDMSLKSWTPEDYKAFGRNRLRIELKAKLKQEEA